jgi:hypothetical protein
MSSQFTINWKLYLPISEHRASGNASISDTVTGLAV